MKLSSLRENRALAALAIVMLFFSGCQSQPAAEPEAATPQIPDDPAERAFLKEAESIVQQSFVLRADADMTRDDSRDLKSLYLEFGHNKAGAKAIGMYFDPIRVKEVQKYLGGISDYHLNSDKVTIKPDSVEVELRYTVTGITPGATTEEWFHLRERPDNDEWMSENNNHFVIISHQIKM